MYHGNNFESFLTDFILPTLYCYCQPTNRCRYFLFPMDIALKVKKIRCRERFWLKLLYRYSFSFNICIMVRNLSALTAV